MRRRKVQSADLVKYNANIRGKNVGDCVKRSLSLATGMSYQDTEKELHEAVKKRYSRGMAPDDAWKHSSVYDKVISAHGGTKHDHDEVELATLEDFVDNVLPAKGTYLITTGSKPDTHNHIVCVIDGKVYDSWDSRDQYVWCYYTFGDDIKVERNSEIDIANMSGEDIIKLLEKFNYFERIEKKAQGMLKRKGYEDAIFQFRSTDALNYKVITNCKVLFQPLNDTDKSRIYNFKLEIIATPFETAESFEKLINKVIDVRLYDRMYSIFQNEVQHKEAEEVKSKVRSKANERTEGRLNKNISLYSNEAKFFKTLPGWAQALATYFSINQPGQFSDSYEIYMIPLPDDPYHDQDDVIMIQGFDAAEFKRNLQHYHDTYEERHDDY